MKAEIPATIPASIVSAKAGLAAISAKIVPPAGTDLYNEFVKDVPMINKSGIAMMSPTDHLPNVSIGIILQGSFVMLSPFTAEYYGPGILSRESPACSLRDTPPTPAPRSLRGPRAPTHDG